MRGPVSKPLQVYPFTRDMARFVSDWKMVGSRATCQPAPTDTDVDFLVMIDIHDRIAFEDEAQRAGFVGHTSGCNDRYAASVSSGTSPFKSWRLGDVNLIVTTEREFYQRFVAASCVAKRLNLLAKPDRVALFQAVLYGNQDGETHL